MWKANGEIDDDAFTGIRAKRVIGPFYTLFCFVWLFVVCDHDTSLELSTTDLLIDVLILLD
jgi:hypothetical protein